VDISQQMAQGHGDHLDLDAHIANKSVRLVKSKWAFDAKGNSIPVDEKTLSVITPENNPHWKEWNDKPHPESEAAFRGGWDEWQKDPNVQYKVDQIKRSCPVCSALSKAQ
jgi:hypothetical protein